MDQAGIDIDIVQNARLSHASSLAGLISSSYRTPQHQSSKKEKPFNAPHTQ
jgi:hypothetical protein